MHGSEVKSRQGGFCGFYVRFSKSWTFIDIGSTESFFTLTYVSPDFPEVGLIIRMNDAAELTSFEAAILATINDEMIAFFVSAILAAGRAGGFELISFDP